MKQLFKKIFIRLLATPFVSTFAVRFFGCGVPIFLLHRITDDAADKGISAQHLRKCLQYLVDNGYTFISLEQLLSASPKHPLPEKPVAFTMDDGFIDQAEIAAPIFLEFNCPLTFFIISGLIDKELWPWDAQISWIINNSKKTELSLDIEGELLKIALPTNSDRQQAREIVRNYFKEVHASKLPQLLTALEKAAGVQLPENPPEQYQALSWDSARELEKQGVRFAPHTITHRILSKLDEAEARQEIIDSWQRLNDNLENPLNVFCYPTGRRLDFGPREINILKTENFLGAVSTMPGYVEPCKQPLCNLFSLPRFELPANMTDFIQYCSWIEHAKKAD